MAWPLKILVYEHTAGGGHAGKELAGSILLEGYAMLRCLISDLSRAGHRTVTLLDSRLRNGSSLLQADQIITIASKSQLTEVFSKTLLSVDAAFIIAPEADGILEALVRESEESGILSLNCSADSVHRASDKALAFQAMKNVGLSLPETQIIDLRHDSESWIRERVRMGFPFILKPLRGGGCEGLSLVATENELRTAVAKVKSASREPLAIAQEFIHGIDASVNLIGTGGVAIPLTLNRQFIRISPPSFESSYVGGLVPLEHDLADQAFEAAIRAVEAIPGLIGYVGVDMVLAEEGPYILEINPRLTTSYIGARRVLKLNLAQAIVQAATKREPPQDVHTTGCAVFYKVPNVPIPDEEFRKERLQVDLISPALHNEPGGLSLVLVYTPTLAMAKKVQSVLSEAGRN